ncbi:unnamed protein product [Cyprideis torosa]|uniref:Uncharacterized protein n=1 Tax=Cyprideis torosa TaxID=163714 RepID=A0A7R8W2T0_9CRUS|nr:unnamed protein product [Cyprideis torosa]CAG0880045.1 unnamed protein product [Cyprideis torosa]
MVYDFRKFQWDVIGHAVCNGKLKPVVGKPGYDDPKKRTPSKARAGAGARDGSVPGRKRTTSEGSNTGSKPKEAKPTGRSKLKADEAKATGRSKPKTDEAKPTGRSKPKPDEMKPTGRSKLKADEAKPTGRSKPKADETKATGRSKPKGVESKPTARTKPKADEARPTRRPKGDEAKGGKKPETSRTINVKSKTPQKAGSDGSRARKPEDSTRKEEGATPKKARSSSLAPSEPTDPMILPLASAKSHEAIASAEEPIPEPPPQEGEKEEVPPSPPPAPEEHHTDDDYEDDFEDYDSDFEELSDEGDTASDHEESGKETDAEGDAHRSPPTRTLSPAGHPSALDAGHPSALDAGHPSALDAGHPSALDAGHHNALDAGHHNGFDVDSVPRVIRRRLSKDDAPFDPKGDGEQWDELRPGTRSSTESGSAYSRREVPGSATYRRTGSSLSSSRASFTDDEKKLEAIRRAIEEENEKLSHVRSPLQSYPTSSFPPTPPVKGGSHDEEGGAISPPANEDEGGGAKRTVERKKSGYNFNSASKMKRTRGRNLSAAQEAKRRAMELADVIELEVTTIDLFHMPPSDYGDYIKAFGGKNKTQRSIQTNEDNQEAETQTLTAEEASAWTQKPISFALPTDPGQLESYVISREDFHGVGRDRGADVVLQRPEEEAQTLSTPVWQPPEDNLEPFGGKRDNQTGVNDFAQFVLVAGKVILSLLEERLRMASGTHGRSEHPDSEALDDLPFAHALFKLPLGGSPALADMEVERIQMSEHAKGGILVLHTFKSCGIGCRISVWSCVEPTSPLSVLDSPATPSALSSSASGLVFLGSQEGNLEVWNLEESLSLHKERFSAEEFATQAPSFTAGLTSFDPIVCIRCRSTAGDAQTKSTELCTLTEGGIVSFWLSVKTEPELPILNQEPGLAHWGKMLLTETRRLELKKHASSNAVFRALLLHPQERTRLLVAVSGDLQPTPADDEGSPVSSAVGGAIFEFSADSSTSSGESLAPIKAFRSSEEGLQPLSLDTFPFGHPYFLAGFSDGSVQLFHFSSTRPLTSWVCVPTGDIDQPMPPVTEVAWSRTRPCVFFARGDGPGGLHLWDLCRGDLSPCFSLAPVEATSVLALPGDDTSHLVFGSSDAELPTVYRLKPELTEVRGSPAFLEELDRFLHYVSIL